MRSLGLSVKAAVPKVACLGGRTRCASGDVLQTMVVQVQEADRSVRVIVLLQEVARSDTPLTANEIAERTGLPKATVYRLCDQLLAANLIRRQVAGRGFLPGPGLVELAQSVLAGRSVYAARHATIAWVAREIGETCNLVVPDGTGMVYWDRVETEWPLRLQLPIGSRVPFHATASGKLYLSSLSEEHRSRLLSEIELSAFTENTIVSPPALLEHLAVVASQGYSLDNEEFIEGMSAVAVAVVDDRGRYAASLAVHAPKSRMSIDDAKSYVDKLRQAAWRISSGVPETV